MQEPNRFHGSAPYNRATGFVIEYSPHACFVDSHLDDSYLQCG